MSTAAVVRATSEMTVVNLNGHRVGGPSARKTPKIYLKLPGTMRGTYYDMSTLWCLGEHVALSVRGGDIYSAYSDADRISIRAGKLH